MYIYIYILYIYTWNPNVPCFDWKRPCFGGKTKDKMGSRYIYPLRMWIIQIGWKAVKIWQVLFLERPVSIQTYIVGGL